MTAPLDLKALSKAPFLLRADNFTPPARTPWGGTRIIEHYKTGVPLAPERRYPKVGESWEVSVEPDFPSRVDGHDVTLAEVIAHDPAAVIGREAAHDRDSTALLVKLLDAADALSVQIHPSDEYEGLGNDEAGKPESWYVLEAEEGAGLYLGLAPSVSEAQMRAALSSGDDVSKLLCFVPVVPGDFFVIEAGTIHAIGPGLTLVEPQHVAPKKRGVTYRYWDWNRRYDAAGRPDANGAPRALHVEHALAVTAWDRPRGDAFLAEIRHRAGPVEPASGARLERLCGRGAPIESPHLDVRRIAGTGQLSLGPAGGLRALSVVEGEIRLEGPGFTLPVAAGRSAVIPASVEDVSASLSKAHGLICSIA